MKTYRQALAVVCVLSGLSLSACGEGYEMIMVRDQVPYTEERTAGPGVAYVRAHMMPQKSVLLPETTVIEDASPIFEKKVEKK